MSHGFHATTLFLKYVLMGHSSFAIWDKNKVIMAISAAIWAINLGFQLAGKLTLSYPPVNPNEYDLISGIVKVNDHFQSFGLLALFISRFALNGCLRQDLAQLRTLRSAETFTSTCLSPMSFYCSSCSSACCAFAGVGVHSIFRTSSGNRWGIAGSRWS
jgi:hypothetical protein